MKSAIKVGKIIGIPIKLHWTFLLILPLFIFSFANAPNYQIFGKIELHISFSAIESLFLRYSFSTIAAFLLFFSVLLHELSHSYFAKKYGAKIGGITLFIFGGIAMMENIPKDPKEELRIAIAGPMMSFAIATFLLLAYFGIKISHVAFYHPVEILFFSIGFINMILGGFNLIPAFPMDGGRILRSFLARKWKFIRATKKSALIGKIFAIIMGISGVLFDPFVFILMGERGTNIWTVLISFFLYIGASEEENATITYAALEGMKVEDVMRKEVMSVPSDMSIADLKGKMLEEKAWEYVVTEGNSIKGFGTFELIKKLPADKKGFLKIGDVIKSSNIIIISAEENAIAALKGMIRYKQDILGVEKDGNFLGIVTKRDLANFMEILKE